MLPVEKVRSCIEYAKVQYSHLHPNELEVALWTDVNIPNELVLDVLDYFTNPQPKETITMGTVNIQQVTYVNGTDVKNVSDETIFSMIADLNKKIKDLDALNITGPAVKANRNKLVESVEELQDIVNARYEETEIPEEVGTASE